MTPIERGRRTAPGLPAHTALARQAQARLRAAESTTQTFPPLSALSGRGSLGEDHTDTQGAEQ